jgi:hydrogenase maturation protease
MPRGGAPGTLYVLEPELEGDYAMVTDAHAMSLPVVFAAVRALGGRMPRTLLVGCEPESVAPGIGLSECVARAVPDAIELIRGLLTSTEVTT